MPTVRDRITQRALLNFLTERYNHRAEVPDDWRPFPGVGPGVNEIRIDSSDGWFRVMYVAKFEEAIYVLHSFQKSTRKTARNDVEIAKTRYRAVIAERKTLK